MSLKREFLDRFGNVAAEDLEQADILEWLDDVNIRYGVDIKNMFADKFDEITGKNKDVFSIIVWLEQIDRKYKEK